MKPSTLRCTLGLARARPRPTSALTFPSGPHPAPAAFPTRLTTTRAFTSTPSHLRPTTSQTQQYSACPSCHTPLPPLSTALCPSCSSLLPPPPPSASHFALFALDPAYNLDLAHLKRSFLQAQQKVHPDLFSGQGERETWAQGWSGRVNDGYKVLVDPRARGEYLLGLHDVRIDETDSVTEPDLLMEVMEIREALDEAQTEEQVDQIRQDNKDKIASLITSLSSAFSATPPDLALAKDLLIHYKYLQNIEGVCREWAPGRPIQIQH